MQAYLLFWLLLGAWPVSLSSNAFVPPMTIRSNQNHKKKSLIHSAGDVFEVTVDLPPSNSDVTATMKFESVLPVPSEVVQVRYRLPFGLDVTPSKGLAVCTANGAGGEQVGDVLRYTSYWKLGLPQGGNALIDSAAAFSGGLKWQCSMYDVMSAKNWEQVVEALVSNTESRTDEVVLLFERPLGDAALSSS